MLASVAMLALAPPAAAETVVIKLRSVTTSAVGQDTPPKGESKGDRIVLASRLSNAVAQFDQPRGATVGSDRGTITFLSKTRISIDGVAQLPGGTIHFRGTGAFGKNEPIPVVGGTGRFSGARGTLTVGTGDAPLNTYRLKLPLVV